MTEELNFSIYEIKISERGAYSASRWLSHDLKIKKNNVKYTTVKEGLEYKFEDNEKGGIIVFSTAVNSIELEENKVLDWIKKKAATLENQLLKDKKIDDLGKKHNLAAWTVGKSLSGRYTVKNSKVFDENSLSVEIIGTGSNELLNIAEELCIMFLQESVLVKDYSTNKVFLVNAE